MKIPYKFDTWVEEMHPRWERHLVNFSDFKTFSLEFY